jgi:hypothetical protein
MVLRRRHPLTPTLSPRREGRMRGRAFGLYHPMSEKDVSIEVIVHKSS